MNTMTTSKWVKGCLITAALVSAPLLAPLANAAPSSNSPEMQRALAKAAQGPDSLRRYIQRTKPIYMLDYNDVMAQLNPQQLAATPTSVLLAQDGTR